MAAHRSKHPLYTAEGNAITTRSRAYQRMDAWARARDDAEEAALFVVSDHGFAPCTGS
jgi:hypothetical protein